MKRQHSKLLDEIYLKNYISSSHSNKIDTKSILVFALSNAVMITVSMVIFSLITDNDNLSIKLKAFNNSQINITEGNYIIEETTASTTLAYTSVINTQNMQVTEAPANFNLETTSTPSVIEIYGVVTTEKDPLNLRNLIYPL